MFRTAGDGARREPLGPAEALRLQFAEAWGEMSASWGVAPAIGRVHAYLMVRDEPLTEREIREALGLSHRAASLALTDAEAWGIVERVSEPRRVGRRGPAGTAYVAVGDHWQWFTRVIAERKIREGDPIVEVIARTAGQAGALAAAHPADAELAALRDWLVAFNAFVRLFDRSVGLIPKLAPRELERGMRLLGEVSGRDRPAARPPPRSLAGRRRARADRGAQPPLADGRPPGDEADVGGRPDDRALGAPGYLEARPRRRSGTTVDLPARAEELPYASSGGIRNDRRPPRWQLAFVADGSQSRGSAAESCCDPLQRHPQWRMGHGTGRR